MAKSPCTADAIPAVRLSLTKDRCLRGAPPSARTPADVVRFLQRHYGCKAQEFFLAVYMNAAGEIVNVHEVAMGGISQAAVDPRVLFAGALSSGASTFIICHNHPSGDGQPSSADLDLTRTLVSGARILGLQILDHIVIARGGAWTSFREKGLM